MSAKYDSSDDDDDLLGMEVFAPSATKIESPVKKQEEEKLVEEEESKEDKTSKVLEVSQSDEEEFENDAFKVLTQGSKRDMEKVREKREKREKAKEQDEKIILKDCTAYELCWAKCNYGKFSWPSKVHHSLSTMRPKDVSYLLEHGHWPPINGKTVISRINL